MASPASTRHTDRDLFPVSNPNPHTHSGAVCHNQDIVGIRFALQDPCCTSSHLPPILSRTGLMHNQNTPSASRWSTTRDLNTCSVLVNNVACSHANKYHTPPTAQTARVTARLHNSNSISKVALGLTNRLTSYGTAQRRGPGWNPSASLCPPGPPSPPPACAPQTTP